MIRRTHSVIVGLSLAVALSVGAVAAPAATAASNPVIADCIGHGRLTQTYTEAQLKLALSTLPAEVKQYTNCSDVITNALPAAIARSRHGGTGGGGSGGSFLPTPVIVILVLLALAGITFGALAIRRRRQPLADSAEDSGPPPDPGG